MFIAGEIVVSLVEIPRTGAGWGSRSRNLIVDSLNSLNPCNFGNMVFNLSTRSLTKLGPTFSSYTRQPTVTNCRWWALRPELHR